MELKDLINSAKLNILSLVRRSTIESTEWKGIWEGTASRDARGALWNIGCGVESVHAYAYTNTLGVGKSLCGN